MTKTKILLIIILFFIGSLVALKFTRAQFSDSETVLGNSIQVGVWGITPVATPEATITPVSTETPSPEAPTPTPTEIPTQTPTPINTPTPTPVTTARLVINEVYYDVAPDKGQETIPRNEWVELYNNTDQPINLKNWSIADNSDQRTISLVDIFIPSHGFALLTNDANTWTYWTIPTTAVKISLGQEIGNGLANSGDRLTLKDDVGNVIDQMSYGSDTTFFNLAPVHEGHSWEREPDGKDTDTAADFIDRSSPSPGS